MLTRVVLQGSFSVSRLQLCIASIGRNAEDVVEFGILDHDGDVTEKISCALDQRSLERLRIC